MRKIYSFLLMIVMAVCVSFQAQADDPVTVKVNATGIGKIYFSSFGPSGETVITSAEQQLPNDCGGDVVGTMYCPAGYTMTAWNELFNEEIEIYPDGDQTCFNVNPGVTPPGTVIDITVTEGGSVVVEEKTVTFVFSPEGCGYIVTTHYENDTYVEDETYVPEAGSDEVEVPYDPMGSYLIKPNDGFTLQNAKDESNVNNPHYTGIGANPDDGFIHGSMGTIDAGSVIIVTAVKAGSFSVKGVGDNIANIQMTNLNTYEYVAVSSDFTTIPCDGSTQYKISSSTAAQLWKVEVTDDEDYTTLLEGTFGNFYYTPNAGDKVVIYTDKPVQYAKVSIEFEGEGVTKNIISEVQYGSNLVDESQWQSDYWNTIAGDVLRITFNETGFTNFSCKVNGTPQTIQTPGYGSTSGRYVSINLDNGAVDQKDYKIVISAEKEKKINVTLQSNHPEGVRITFGGTVQTFTATKTLTVPQYSSLTIEPKDGWLINSLLVDGEEPAEGIFVYSTLNLGSEDCTVNINVSEKKELRTKTVVVYVDESVANPTYLSLTFSGETGSQDIRPGYNFVKFCDADRPFTLGYYVSPEKESIFYVDGNKVSSPNPCGETLNIDDGAVIKYFAGTPVQQVVTYDIAEDVAEMIEIYHDHTTGVDHGTTNQYSLFKGTQIHIKLKAPADARKRAEAVSPIIVKVDGVELEPDADGVYSFTVGDNPPVIAVTKAVTTGVEDVFTEGNESFTIYNLQGMAVKKNATAADFNSLPAGVYIANGQKVMVK